MHFPSTKTTLTALLSTLLLTPSIFALPLQQTRPPHSSTSLTTRQAGEILDIVETIIDIAKDVWDWVGEIDDAQHDAEGTWTQNTVDRLIAQYPDKNVLVYANQDSQYSLVNAAHSHYELNLPDGPQTKGYDIWVFDSGSFTLAGDGGFINWCFDGNYQWDGIDGDEVTFNAINDQDYTPPSAVSIPTPTRANSANADGIYLVNCQDSNDGSISSGVAWYANLNPGSNVGQTPDAYFEASTGEFVTWEQDLEAPWGDYTLSWNIDSAANGYAYQEYSGPAAYGNEGWSVYRDQGEYLFASGSVSCYSEYWAF